MLISVDFPDAMTGGLRRTTEVTRGDLTVAAQQYTLGCQLRALERRLSGA